MAMRSAGEPVAARESSVCLEERPEAQLYRFGGGRASSNFKRWGAHALGLRDLPHFPVGRGGHSSERNHRPSVEAGGEIMLRQVVRGKVQG